MRGLSPRPTFLAALGLALVIDLAGRVLFMFQPGEEGFHGARHMIDEGALTDVGAAFALHVSPNLPSGTVWTKGGPLMASADELYITVTGKGGHASTPYLANDPMPVAAEIVQALQVVVTRRINTFDPVVITITQMKAGTTNNVIPETVELVGTLRGVSEAGRKQATDAMNRLVEGIASFFGPAVAYLRAGAPAVYGIDVAGQQIDVVELHQLHK